MKKTKDIKMYYFFDEAGDPQILGRKGLLALQSELVNDDYLKDIPKEI